MNAREKIKNVINGRTCCVIARGASVLQLEQNIELFRDKNICWASLNLFTPAENILSKINKQLDFVSDCTNASRRDNFELELRLPRLESYLDKVNNLLQISNTVINDIKAVHREDILIKYSDKIITIDDIFTGENYSRALFDAPPNSITLLFATLIAGQAKRIIVFGLDGHNGTNNNALASYYKADLERIERLVANGREEAGSLVTDMKDFNNRFLNIFELYKNTYNNKNVEILNCSINSYYNCLPKIAYSQLVQYL